jgi:hypothetical protein
MLASKSDKPTDVYTFDVIKAMKHAKTLSSAGSCYSAPGVCVCGGGGGEICSF